MPRTPSESRPAALKRFQKSLGKKFAAIRRELDESKAGMAERLSVTGMTVGNWEKGEGVNLHTIYTYARCQKKTLSQFLFEFTSEQ